MSSNLIILSLIITVCVCVEIPSSIKRCARKDNNLPECLTEAVNGVLSNSKSPVTEIGLPSVDPLEIPSLSIPAGSGAVSFQQNYRNVKITGFSDGKCSSVNMDFGAKIFSLNCSTPSAELNFDYEVDGKVLLLPIRGKGPGTIVLENMNVGVIFKLSEYEKEGGKCYKVDTTKVDLTPQLLKIHLEDLFDGDKTLGDNVNQVLNDNWQDVFADVKSKYEEAFGQIFSSIADHVFGKVSIKELFGDE